MLALLQLLLAVGAATANTRYIISAPNVFHVGIQEKVSVVVYGTQAPVTVQVYLQDYPHRRKTFSQVQAQFTKDTPEMLTVKVDPASVPDPGSLDKQYVYLVAKCDHPQLKFQKEMKILLSFRTGVILIQTDKPIYTPKQTVNIRVIPLDFNLYPTKYKISVIVKNPQGIRVQQWKDLTTDTGIISKVLDLDDYALKGNWTIEAYHDSLAIHNTSTVFEVREYVLPKFSVKIKAPDAFLPNTKNIHISISSKYTYGKVVHGSANVRVKIVTINKEFRLMSFSQSSPNGTLTFKVGKAEILAYYRELWFPEGSRLQIQADVTEQSTGITERAVNSVLFTSSPYVIKFIKTAQYFMPGLQFPIKVVVTNNKDEPLANIHMKITAKAVKSDGSEVDVGQSQLRHKDDTANKGSTGIDGQAEFLVDVPRDVKTLKIKAETEDRIMGRYNAVKDYIASTYSSPSNEYLMVRQRKPASVGQTVFCEAFISSKNVDRLAYMVIARGQIVYQNVIVQKLGIIKTITFKATSMMSPASRLVAYFIASSGHVVSDTTTLEITDSLPNKIVIKDNDVSPEKYPGELYTVQVLGEKNTHIGLLGVDQSVYLLRNKNRLTPESVFKKLDDLDLGCGVASGKDTKGVFKNSGLSVISGSFISDARQDFSCQEPPPKRKKRSVGQDSKVVCCRLGSATDSNNRTCIRRVIDLEVTAYENDVKLRHQCRKEFFKCCVKRFGTQDAFGILGRSASGGGADFLDELNFGGDFMLSDDQIVDFTQVRSYFPETWFFEEKLISNQEDEEFCQKNLGRRSCSSVSLDATVPDTITTWVVQAIAVSNKSGFGIAKPMHLRSFKDFFVSLNIPYSVQRGEQVTILATAYNYRKQDSRVFFFLTADDGFCSVADLHSKTTRLNKNAIKIKGNGGTVSFPITIVPVKYGHISIKVYISNGADGDAVERKLLVVPEGVEERKTQTYVLDPQGVLRDAKQSGEGIDNKINNSTFPSQRLFDKSKSKQIDSIRIEIPKKSIPESINAMVSFTGNMIGPVVTNMINGGLEALLRMPTGCGEQTMIYLSPNVYVLQYLSNTKQVTAAVEAKAYKFIQSGYQRELNYRRNDASFSAWGNSRPGSTWLTAFVIKVFCEASKFDGVQIDENVMCQSVQWLVQHQRADGAFPEVHHVIHREMVGGVYQNGDVAITAFVITALLECQCKGLVQTAAITRAVTYLENHLANLQQPYVLALTTYALAMANSAQRHKANDKLTQSAIYNSASVSRHWNAGGHALNIETAAYALLAQLKLNRLSYAGPIVTWLTEQKNSGGGFKSTTDTCVALQALAKYSEGTAGAKLDLKINIEPSNLDPKALHKPKPLRITKQNALLQQSVDIRPYLRQDGEEFVITTVGTGVAQMQVNLQYNLLTSKEERCSFVIKHTITQIHAKPSFSQSDAPSKGKRRRKGRRKGRGKKRKNRRKNKKNKKNRKKNKKQKTEAPTSLIVNVCAQYKKPGKTGMAIMDIGIITGFEVDKQSVKQIMKKMNDTIANYEISERSIVFYLDSIDSAKPVCVGFKVTRSFDIGAVYPVPIKVYDYYEPDDSCTTFYSLGKSTPEMGRCDGKTCKCTQDKCAALNPSLRNIHKLVRETCSQYDFAIKAKVVYVDEAKWWLTYDVKVEEVIKEGNAKQIVKGAIIQFWKKGSCLNPNLRKKQVVLIMGRDKGERYIIDKSTFVSGKLDRRSSGIVAELKRRVQGGECD